jgi:hypothetical protein
MVILFMVAMYSCNSKVESNSTNAVIALENEVSPKTSEFESKVEVKYRDTISINYKSHKTLLDILKILPDYTMDSWEWSKKDRTKTVDFIEKNNYLIDSTEMYNNIKYIEPNTIGIQVVDGSWTLSIYQFSNDNYFIVTNDIVGDANDIQTYNYINNELVPTKMINWFSDFDYKLLSNNTPNCIEALEENHLGYYYDFRSRNSVEIYSPYLTKNEFEDCFKGNAITYKLNKEDRTFDVVDISWKNDKTEQNEQIDTKTIQSKKEVFTESLKNGKDLSDYFSNSWTLIYHKDNRCDGSTDGEVSNLTSKEIETLIEVEVTNDGKGWACDEKEPKTYSLNFELKKHIKNWDRFEIAGYENQEKNIAYILGAGESDFLKLHFNDDNMITKLEYRSEDPG